MFDRKHTSSFRGPKIFSCMSLSHFALEFHPTKISESKVVYDWLVVSTPLKTISQIGSFPQVGMNINNLWNHHLVYDFQHVAFHDASSSSPNAPGAPKPAVVAWHPSYLGSWLPKFAGKWHGDEFCLPNPEVLSTKSSYSFKIHPDLRISILVIQTKFHISSQEFQGNVSVVGGEVHKFNHLVNRKKIIRTSPKIESLPFFGWAFSTTTGLVSHFVSKTTWQITLMSCPTHWQQISFPRRTPPFFLLGGGNDGSTKSGRKS